jgi:hypothetical protein
MESEEPTQTASTPKSKASATPKTRKSAVKKEENGGGEEGESPTKKSKPAAIPDRVEDLAREDAMMMQMKAVSLIFQCEPLNTI